MTLHLDVTCWCWPSAACWSSRSIPTVAPWKGPVSCDYLGGQHPRHWPCSGLLSQTTKEHCYLRSFKPHLTTPCSPAFSTGFNWSWEWSWYPCLSKFHRGLSYTARDVSHWSMLNKPLPKSSAGLGLYPNSLTVPASNQNQTPSGVEDCGYEQGRRYLFPPA